MRRIVIYGATSAIAEECVRRWAAEPEPSHFVLVGRDVDRLAPIAADLAVRAPGCSTEVLAGAFAGAEGIADTVARATAGGTPEIVLIAFGMLPAQSSLSGDPAALAETLEVNGVWPAVFAQLSFEQMTAAGRGRLVVLGSVAGDRGRRSNYAYGSGKAMVATFVRGLQHAAAGTGVSVTLIKPGPTDTPMARGVDVPGKLAPVSVVAGEVVEATARGRAVAYVPGLWRLIMTVIRLLPDRIFNRLDI